MEGRRRKRKNETVREEIFGRRDGEWRTRARDMGSGELERGIWGVENQSEGYGEWRLMVETVVKRDQ